MKDALELPVFRTAAWNMFYGTPIDQSEPALHATIDQGVTLWHIVESKGSDRDRLFRRNGLKTASFDQWRLAWDPKRWGNLGDYALKLSETAWFATGSKTPQYTHGEFARLTDKLSGDAELVLEAGAYHTPAGIQTPAAHRPENRYKVFIESLLFLAAHAQEVDANGILYAGDDNWDEDGSRSGAGVQTDDLNVMLGRATGLRQIQAGDPTFAGREIDDYRIVHLKKGGHVKPTGFVKTIDGRGAETPRHQIHIREWEWHNIAPPAPKATEHACPQCGLVHTGVVTS